MKRLLSVSIFMFIIVAAHAQITITLSDMPVSGDTLRYSNVNPVGTGINTSIVGAGLAWNYILIPISQTVDTYKTAIAVNPLYALTVGLTAYGYKVADSFPGLGAILPLSIQQIYTFFEKKTSPDRFQAKAFGASIAGFPTPANYAPPDVWYFLPLAYNNVDSSDFSLDISLPGLGGIKETGYRKTTVDAWGTIQTPYYTTPENCIRVKSEINEIDSISFSGAAFGLPRQTVEYKWLVKGDHYPALWVTSNVFARQEIVSSVKYRDSYIDSLNPHDSVVLIRVKEVTETKNNITAYPVPAINGRVTLNIPADWKTFVIQVFDLQSKEVAVFNNQRELNIQNLAPGQYVARITSGDKMAFVSIVK